MWYFAALAAIAPALPPAALTYQIHIPLPSTGFAAAAGPGADARTAMAPAATSPAARARSLRRESTLSSRIPGPGGQLRSPGGAIWAAPPACAAHAIESGAMTGFLTQATAFPELRVTPDKYLPHRYAGASGDFNPIHIDPEFAKAVGLPQNILHGLYSMAQVARAHTEAAGGDPRALRRLSVQFRGMGMPEQEIVVSTTVREAGDGKVVTETVAAQGENQIIRNAEAELALD